MERKVCLNEHENRCRTFRKGVNSLLSHRRQMRGRNEHMIEPPSEDDKRHAAANYLHFEHDNPATCDVYFESTRPSSCRARSP